jgi:hypothetical protein
VSGREVRGVEIDATMQPISEAPYWQGDGETVDATGEPEGTVTTENVPDLGAERPDVEGQSTWADWEGSA